MGAALNILLVCCVSFLMILSFTGTAGAGLYFAGSEEKTKDLEKEARDAYLKTMEDEMDDELAIYEDPRSVSFKTRKESSVGFGQLPYFPTGAFYRRRPVESALTWPDRGSVLPNMGPDSYSLIEDHKWISVGNTEVTVKAVDNISEDPNTIDWIKYRENAWTNLFDKDPLKIDCGDDALNSFQTRSEKFSKTRDIIKPKTDEVTGTTLNYRHQFKSYHDNYKQLYKCLTGSEGWEWDSDNRVRVDGDSTSSITNEKTRVLPGKKPDGNNNKIMDCDFEAVGAGEFGEGGAAKSFPINMIDPVWTDSILGKEFNIRSDPNSPLTADYNPDPKLVNFQYKCLKKPVFGPCKDMKYTEWTPFLASQGEGPRELRHSMRHGKFTRTSGENVTATDALKEKINAAVDPVKGLGRVKCHPTEVLTRVDFEVSEGLDAPKDWVRWGYKCCKM
jgi:hypothetical protein